MLENTIFRLTSVNRYSSASVYFSLCQLYTNKYSKYSAENLEIIKKEINDEQQRIVDKIDKKRIIENILVNRSKDENYAPLLDRNIIENFILPNITDRYKDLHEKLFELKNRDYNWIISLVFGVMCLEAFIYDYASHYFSDSYVRKYLDKLDLLSKWVLIPKLALGITFPTDSQAFEYIRKLIVLRNEFVHSKSISMDNYYQYDISNLKNKCKTMKGDRSKSTSVSSNEISDDVKKKKANLCSFLPFDYIIEAFRTLKKIEGNRHNDNIWILEETAHQWNDQFSQLEIMAKLLRRISDDQCLDDIN